jgi:transposase
MADETLFPVGEAKPKSDEPALAPRFKQALRNQVEYLISDLDSLVALDHEVRTIWGFVEKADLSELYAKIKALEGHVGRSPIDPRILLALWLYATLDGIGSARALEKLCEESLPYRWMCGGVAVNYHTLSDFRADSGAVLDELLIDHVSALRAAGVVSLNRVSHDGVRVRASAGSGSFRRKDTLGRFMQEARAQVETLRTELEQDPGRSDACRKAARQRAAREREARVADALRQYDDVKKKKKHDKDEARVSTTDPDARKMRMADGGTRPAYNVQFSTDTATQIVVSVDVINGGSDFDQLVPAVQRIQKQHGKTPQEMLVDGGFAKREAIEEVAGAPFNCTVYAPLPKPTTKAQTLERPFKTETPRVTEWRERMATQAAKEIYKERASTVECVNAQARNRGLQQFRVRGRPKVKAVALMFALVHNIVRTKCLLKKAA